MLSGYNDTTLNSTCYHGFPLNPPMRTTPTVAFSNAFDNRFNTSTLNSSTSSTAVYVSCQSDDGHNADTYFQYQIDLTAEL